MAVSYNILCCLLIDKSTAKKTEMRKSGGMSRCVLVKRERMSVFL